MEGEAFRPGVIMLVRLDWTALMSLREKAARPVEPNDRPDQAGRFERGEDNAMFDRPLLPRSFRINDR